MQLVNKLKTLCGILIPLFLYSYCSNPTKTGKDYSAPESVDIYENKDEKSQTDLEDIFKADSENSLDNLVEKYDESIKKDETSDSISDETGFDEYQAQDNIDLYELDSTETETVDPCAPTAKACGDDYRDPVTGKCYPLELTVDSDAEYIACLDYSDTPYEKSYCYDDWTELGNYHIAGHPTGSHANCGRKIVWWHILGAEYSIPSTTWWFSAGDSGTLELGVEDDTGAVTYDYIDYNIKKK